MEYLKAGGEGGIRTPDTLSGMAAFEAARFNRSRTSPRQNGDEFNSAVRANGNGFICTSFYQCASGGEVHDPLPLVTKESSRKVLFAD